MNKELTRQEKLTALTDKIDSLLGGEIIGCGSKDCHKGNIPYQVGEDEWEWGGCEVCVNSGKYEPPIKPIFAHDILRALETNYTVDRQIHIDWCCEWIPKGTLRVTLANGHPLINVIADIDLSKPLHEQTEITISSLYDLFLPN